MTKYLRSLWTISPETDKEIGYNNAWSEAEVVDGKDEDGNKIVHYHVDISSSITSQISENQKHLLNASRSFPK